MVCTYVTSYSAVPNKRAVWNKQAGGTFFENSINEQSGINEKGGFFKNSDKRAGWNKKAGWNIEKFTNITYLGYQVPLHTVLTLKKYFKKCLVDQSTHNYLFTYYIKVDCSK